MLVTSSMRIAFERPYRFAARASGEFRCAIAR
jgi:hypothetical protein